MSECCPVHARYATWIRIVSYVIDNVVLFVSMFALTAVLAAFDVAPPSKGLSMYDMIGIIISWLYFAFQESSVHQATLGMRAVGIVVTDLSGKRITFRRATGRYFSEALSVLFLGIGYIMIVFSKTGQGLHDRLAETLVVYKQSRCMGHAVNCEVLHATGETH